MSKKQVISLVTVGAMLLSGNVSVFADELIVGSPESTVIVEVSTENQLSENEAELPADVEGSENSGTVIGSDDATITPPSTDDSIIVQPNSSEEPKEEFKENALPTLETPTSETPKLDKEKPVKDLIKESQGDNDFTSKPAEEASLDKPIVSINGDKVVGTQDSKVLVQKEDGSIQPQEASDVGATINSDGTIALKTSTGEIKRLVKTGDDFVGSLAMTVSGIIILFGTIFTKLKYALN